MIHICGVDFNLHNIVISKSLNINKAPPAPSFGTGAVGALPFAVMFENNQVVNRSFIELFGYMPPNIVLGRNLYERFERFWDSAIYLLLGIFGPIAIEKALNKKREQAFFDEHKLKHFFNKTPTEFAPSGKRWYHKANDYISNLGRRSPLRVRWEWLRPETVKNLPSDIIGPLVREVGFKSKDKFYEFINNPAIKKKLFKYKSQIVWLDLAMLTGMNLISMWGKNAITKLWSGKKGFSGTFNYTSANYQEQASKSYEDNKMKRFLRSLAVAVGLTVSLPPIIRYSVKGKSRAAKGLMNTITKPFLNYSNAIFMSKYMVVWGGFLSWIIVGALAARDKNELREHLTKTTTVLVAYTFLDDLISGLAALKLQKKAKAEGVTVSEQGFLGLPKALSLSRVLEQVGSAKHHLYKGARANMWMGMIGAAAFTGATATLVNNWYTKKKVLAEQAALIKPYLRLLNNSESARPEN